MGSLKPPWIFLINIFCNYVTQGGSDQKKRMDPDGKSAGAGGGGSCDGGSDLGL